MADIPFNDYYRRLMDAIMQQQMGQAQGISEAVPRRDPLNDLYFQLPELRKEYQPSEYWKYGQPVRSG